MRYIATFHHDKFQCDLEASIDAASTEDFAKKWFNECNAHGFFEDDPNMFEDFDINGYYVDMGGVWVIPDDVPIELDWLKYCLMKKYIRIAKIVPVF